MAFPCGDIAQGQLRDQFPSFLGNSQRGEEAFEKTGSQGPAEGGGSAGKAALPPAAQRSPLRLPASHGALPHLEASPAHIC